MINNDIHVETLKLKTIFDIVIKSLFVLRNPDVIDDSDGEFIFKERVFEIKSDIKWPFIPWSSYTPMIKCSGNRGSLFL